MFINSTRNKTKDHKRKPSKTKLNFLVLKFKHKKIISKFLPKNFNFVKLNTLIKVSSCINAQTTQRFLSKLHYQNCLCKNFIHNFSLKFHPRFFRNKLKTFKEIQWMWLPVSRNILPKLLNFLKFFFFNCYLVSINKLLRNPFRKEYHRESRLYL